MLSYPDFMEKQIILLESQDIKNIVIKNSNLTVKEEGKILNQISLLKIFAVFIVGSVTFTSVLIQKLIKNGAIIILMNRNYSPYCVIGGETEGNYLLRERQYCSQNQLEKSKIIIANKIQNQIILLKDIRKKSTGLKESIKNVSALEEKIHNAVSAKELLGFEGNAAKIFFSNYFDGYQWRGRKPRTKFDEINTLLDIGYTLLFNFIEAHLRLYGFDIYKGFYHTEFYQRKSLVCDIVEPFRCIIDQSLRKIINLKQFDKKDFKVKNGGYYLKSGCSHKYVKNFLEAIMSQKAEIFRYIQKFYRNSMKNLNEYPIFLIKK